MGYCTNCGHQLEAGRFCTSCGHPVPATPEARTDTAERPAVPAPPPPPPSTPPPSSPSPPPRFPLFADETEPPAYVAPEPAGPRPRPVWPFVLVAAVLLLVIGVLVGVAVHTGDDGGTGDQASDEPTRSAGGTGSAGSLTQQSTVQVPTSAPPNQDVTGKPTTYVGANLLDGVPETCWRMPGDGSGEEVTVTLPRATHLRRVGIINGYAKTAQDAQGRELDWYHGNRRVLAVEWVFDDGSTVEQDLADTTAVQSVDVDVTTTTIVLRLVAVSPPGTGPAARDYTAISDLSLVAP